METGTRSLKEKLRKLWTVCGDGESDECNAEELLFKCLEDVGWPSEGVCGICLERLRGLYDNSEKAMAMKILQILVEYDLPETSELDCTELCDAIVALMDITDLRESAMWLFAFCLCKFDGLGELAVERHVMSIVLELLACDESPLYPILLETLLDEVAGNAALDYATVCDSCMRRYVAGLDRETILECIYIMVKRKVLAIPSSFLDAVSWNSMSYREADLVFGIMLKADWQPTKHMLAKAVEILCDPDNSASKNITKIFFGLDFEEWSWLESTGAMQRISQVVQMKNYMGKRYIGMILTTYLQSVFRESVESSGTMLDCYVTLLECLPVMTNGEFLVAISQIEALLESSQSIYLTLSLSYDLASVLRDWASNDDPIIASRCDKILSTYFE